MTDDSMRRRRERAARAFIKRRAELGLTQPQVAYRADVAVRTVSNFENGRWPNARTRAKLEEALEWEPGEIERIASPPPPRIDPELINATLGRTVEELEALVDYVRRKRGETDEPGESLRAVNGGHHQ